MALLPARKFAVRVRHYSDTYYVAEYTHYRFFPTWHCFYEWIELGSCSAWNPVLGHLGKMEKFAQQFASMEQVQAWEREQLAYAAKSQTARAEMLRKAIPYDSQVIVSK